jgi:hypothetical protein
MLKFNTPELNILKFGNRNRSDHLRQGICNNNNEVHQVPSLKFSHYSDPLSFEMFHNQAQKFFENALIASMHPAAWIFAWVKARQIKKHVHFGVDRVFLAIVVRSDIPKAIICDMSQMT